MVEVGGSNPPGPTTQSPINTDFLLAEHSSFSLAHEERQLANVGAETLVTSHLRFSLAAEFGIILESFTTDTARCCVLIGRTRYVHVQKFLKKFLLKTAPPIKKYAAMRIDENT